MNIYIYINYTSYAYISFNFPSLCVCATHEYIYKYIRPPPEYWYTGATSAHTEGTGSVLRRTGNAQGALGILADVAHEGRTRSRGNANRSGSAQGALRKISCHTAEIAGNCWRLPKERYKETKEIIPDTHTQTCLPIGAIKLYYTILTTAAAAYTVLY